jgi:AraC-like DNA-binding protein
VEDFASAVLLGAVQRSLRSEGIIVDARLPRDALLPLAEKRRVLATVAEAHGLLPLLRVGLVLPAMPTNPIIAALTAARGPADLLARWTRLERFTHSRHRVVVREAGERHLIAEHVGSTDQPPQPYEDALIVGTMAALLEWIGVSGLLVRIGMQEAYVKGHWTLPEADECTSLWTFRWDSIGAPAASESVKTCPGACVITQARRLISSDLGQRWTLSVLGEALRTSTRSLQRSFAAEGGFGELLAAARSDAAAEMLINTALPISIVGFACGYADQPHFTRAFKRRTACAPAAYRAAFAKSGSAK